MTDDEVIRIPLRSRDGSVRAWAIVDREDADLAELRWSYRSPNGANEYAYRSSGQRHLHRIVLERVIGRSLDIHEQCDHIDGSGLNNKRSNLRAATVGQNHANRSRPWGGSRYLGVSFDQARGRWKAQVQRGGNVVFQGRYDTEEAAARAYDRAAVEHHGEFARPNFHDGGDA